MEAMAARDIAADITAERRIGIYKMCNRPSPSIGFCAKIDGDGFYFRKDGYHIDSRIMYQQKK